MDDPYHADAARFLDALGSGPFLFQTYPDRAVTDKRGMILCKRGTLATCGALLAKANARGAAVAVLPNVNDGSRKRKGENIRSVRALFVDLDGAPLEPVQAGPLPPHIVTETSPGRWHAFWRVADCPLDDFVRLQRALCKRFNGDASMADVARCVRVPGFWHHKGEPFLSRIVGVRDALPYTYAEILDAFAIPPLPAKPAPMTLGRIPLGKRETTYFGMAASAHRRGIPQADEAERLLIVNARDADPPMPADEVRAIVARAYALPVTGHASIPYAALDSMAFRTLDSDAVRMVLLAYRRYDGTNNGFSLAWSECRNAFPRKESAFKRARTRAVASGLLIVATPASKPSKGSKPRPALYRLKHPHRAAGEPYQAAA